MAPCDHVAWIQVAGAQDCTITDTGRLHRVVHELINPVLQTPSLLFFLGNKSKDEALRQIFPQNNFRRTRSGGVANVRLDTRTVAADRPVLFADGDLTAPIPPSQAAVSCHHNQTYPISWPYPSSQSLVDAIFAKLLLPCACVLSVFVEDLYNMGEFRNALLRWVSLGIYTSLPDQVRPSLILVASQVQADASLRAFCAELQSHRHGIGSLFTSVTLVTLAPRYSLSQVARHRPLREVISTQTREMQERHRRFRWHFSAIHLEALWSASLRHFVTSLSEPFDFVRATRTYAELQDDCQKHIANFLRLAIQHGVSFDEMAAYVASSFLMDAYPAKTHRTLSLILPVAD